MVKARRAETKRGACGWRRVAAVALVSAAVGAVASAAETDLAQPDAARCPLPDPGRSAEIWWSPCPEGEPDVALALPLPVDGAAMIFLPTALDECGGRASGTTLLGKYELTVGQAAAILAGDPDTGETRSLAEGLQALADRYDDGSGKAKSEAVAPILWRIRSLSFGVWNTPEGEVSLAVRENLARPVVGLTPDEIETLADRYTRWCYRAGACRAGIAEGGVRRLLRLPSDDEWAAAAGAEPTPFDPGAARDYANIERGWSEPKADEAVVGLGRAPTKGGFYDLFGNAAEMTRGPAGGLTLRGGSFASAAAEGFAAPEPFAPYVFDQSDGRFLGVGRRVEAGARLALAAIAPVPGDDRACGASVAVAGPSAPDLSDPAFAPPALADAGDRPAAPQPPGASLAGPELTDQGLSGHGGAGSGGADQAAAEAPPSVAAPTVVGASGLRPPPDAAADAAEVGRLRDAAKADRLEEEARLRSAEAGSLRMSLRALESEAQSLRSENRTLLDETTQLRSADAARRTRLCSALAENMFLSARFQIRYWRQFHKLTPIIAELETLRPTDPGYYDEVIDQYAAQKRRLRDLAARVFARYLRAAEAMAEQGPSCAAEGFAAVTAMGLEGEAAAAGDGPAATGVETAMLAREHAIAAAEEAQSAGVAAVDAALAEGWRDALMERGRLLAEEME